MRPGGTGQGSADNLGSTWTSSEKHWDQKNNLTTPGIPAKWLTFTYCNSLTLWTHSAPQNVLKLLFQPSVTPNYLLHSWLIHFFSFCLKIPYHQSYKQQTKPEPAPLTGWEGRLLPETRFSADACMHRHTHAQAHTHTHTGFTGLPIISQGPQTSGILPAVSEWGSPPLVTWKGFSALAFTKGKEPLLLPSAWENFRNVCKNRCTPNQITRPLLLQKLVFLHSLQPEVAFVPRGAGNSVIRRGDDNGLSCPPELELTLSFLVWVWVLHTQGGFNATAYYGSGDQQFSAAAPPRRWMAIIARDVGKQPELLVKYHSWEMIGFENKLENTQVSL